MNRSEAQQRLFTLFKTCIKAYKTETFHQREVLRKLYIQVVAKIEDAENVHSKISVEYLSILKQIKDLYISSLKTTLVQYKTSKIAYITMNQMIFQKRQQKIEQVHEKCRIMLREAASDLHGSFIENAVKPQLATVSESVELGEQKYKKVTTVIADEQKVFLFSASEDFVQVAIEVRKSLNEFEYTVKNMIFEWKDLEERIIRIVRQDQASMLYEIKECLHDFNIDQTQGLKPFFARYHEIESIVVSYMMERYYSFVKRANNEEDSVISSKAPDTIYTLSSETEKEITEKKLQQRIKKKQKKKEVRKQLRLAEQQRKEEEMADGKSFSQGGGEGAGDGSRVSQEDARLTARSGNSHHGNKSRDDNGIEESKSEKSNQEKEEEKEEEEEEEEEDGEHGAKQQESDVDDNQPDKDGHDATDDDDDEDDEDDSDEEEDLRDEDGKLVLPPNKCGLDFLLRLNTSIEKFTNDAKGQLMGPIRERFMAAILAKEAERKSQRFDLAQELVANVATQWDVLHKDLRMLVAAHIVNARNQRTEMSLKLWSLARDFRNWEFNRLQLLNEASVWKFKSLRRPEMTRSDNKDLKLFEQYSRVSQNVLISAAVDLAPGHAEVMPAELSILLTHINHSPKKMMTEFSSVIDDFYSRSHCDDMHYNFLTTLEHLSTSLNDVRLQVCSIMDDYEQDKVDTLNLLKYNSNVKRHITPSIQVGGLLSTMVETVVARSAMSHNLADQMSVTDRRSKVIEKKLGAFLQDNSFSDNFLADGTMTPEFIEATAMGHNDVEECKLKSVNANRHGICLKCTAELFYTIKRNDMMYTSKLKAVSQKVQGMVTQEIINGRRMRKQLHTLLKSACLEMDKLEFGIRNEIIGCLEVAFRKRVDAEETNSRVNEPPGSVGGAEGRIAGPFVRDTDAILQELVAAVKKPPRREGVVIDYPEFSDFSESEFDDDDEEEEHDHEEGSGEDGFTLSSNDFPHTQGETEQQTELNLETGSQVGSPFPSAENDLEGDLNQFSVEDVYFNGIFQRTHTELDGNPVLHGDKTMDLPVNPMEFSTSEVLKEEEKEIDEFLRVHEEFNIREKDMEDMAKAEENEAIAEAHLVATYDETQEALEKERLLELERLREEEEKKAAEREAIRVEAYEQAEMEFFQKYPDKDPNIYSYSNKFDPATLSFKETKTMVNPKTYEEASDEYKDLALEKLLNIGGNPVKNDPFDLYVPPPEVPGLPLATVLARYQDLVRNHYMLFICEIGELE